MTWQRRSSSTTPRWSSTGRAALFGAAIHDIDELGRIADDADQRLAFQTAHPIAA